MKMINRMMIRNSASKCWSEKVYYSSYAGLLALYVTSSWREGMMCSRWTRFAGSSWREGMMCSRWTRFAASYLFSS